MNDIHRQPVEREPTTGPLAILPLYARDMAKGQLEKWASRRAQDGEEVETDGGYYYLSNGVAIVSIIGPLSQYGGWWYDGHCSVQARIMHALSDPRASAVVLEINSPGGVVSGCFDAVRAVRVAVQESGKSVDVWVGDSCYSAGYAWACVGNRIHLPDSGGVGSVGVIGTIVSYDRMNKEMGIDVYLVRSGAQKADTHPEGPIDPAAIAREQVEVDRLAVIFAGIVAESRGLSVEDVLARQGGTVHGQEAVSAGFADSVTTFSAVLAMAEQAGRERRMQEIARRLGLAANASEAEIVQAINAREIDAGVKVQTAEATAKKATEDAAVAVGALATCAADLAIRSGVRTSGQRDATIAFLKAAPAVAAVELSTAAPVLPALRAESSEGTKGGEAYAPKKSLTVDDYAKMSEPERAQLAQNDRATFDKLRAEFKAQRGATGSGKGS